jgi:hypothetical protein
METCIYCGQRPGITRDHVPPDCMFHHPLPQDINRITVPCCEECRRAGEADETLLRNIFVSTRESEQNPIAAKLAGKRDRSFQRRFAEMEKVLRYMVLAKISTKDGKTTAWGFDMNTPVIDRFVLRVSRSLLHEETKCGYVDCEVSWALHPNDETQRELVAVAKRRYVSEEFAYCGLFAEGETNSGWLFSLYGGSIIFLASLFARGKPPTV